jgi:hypothetical protein
VFDLAAVTSFSESLARAVQSPTGLDDQGRIDAIRALEQLVCVATAGQAALSVELDVSQRAAQEQEGVPEAQRGRGIAAQVALARRESPNRGQRHLGLAKVVATELPHTWAAWRNGHITEWKATLVARETACLPREARAQVDAVVAADPERLAEMGDRQLATECRREGYRLDAEASVSRRRHAEAERRVTLRPAPDAMTWLTALLPVKEGVAAYAALRRTAEAARACGDPRTQGQVMADALVGSVLGAAAEMNHDVTGWDSPAAGPAAADPAARSIGITLGLLMTDTALLGRSDEPAHLESFGAIPAELARELVDGACSSGEKVWIRRLYTSPTSGELVAMDSRSRLFRGSLARFIRLRDLTCRTPWCDAPIGHADHAVAVEEGGETEADNGQGLCRACNHAKQAPGWRARPSPRDAGHRITTTTPTGHVYGSGPPVLVTIRETPIRLDYISVV